MDQNTKNKINALSVLFNQRDEIDNKIVNLLEDKEGMTILGIPVEIRDSIPKGESKLISSDIRGKLKSEVKIKGDKRWSRIGFDSCQKCGTTKIKHKSAGYCMKCYRPGLPKHVREIEYTCLDCKEVFVSAQDKIDVVCPKCGSTHVY